MNFEYSILKCSKFSLMMNLLCRNK